MQSNSLNEIIRNKTAEYFKSAVKGKHVMDFGGGTGADLKWLTENAYEVCFCEPSKAMRDIAIERNKKEIKSQQIQFLQDEQADFTKWGSNTFPRKFDAILADFCVFNTIDDIKFMFSKLCMILSTWRANNCNAFRYYH